MLFFFQAEDGIRDHAQSRGLGDVYKRQSQNLRISEGICLLSSFTVFCIIFFIFIIFIFIIFNVMNASVLIFNCLLFIFKVRVALVLCHQIRILVQCGYGLRSCISHGEQLFRLDLNRRAFLPQHLRIHFIINTQ
eukprot:TRINITY_DN11124_c0_g1_i4.p2 TRINITY_DN11124_c0_g1~~TRINITY_DN11124_c0_g1_i4.p2  ORF type:complete len:135 (+),score=36.25 TRINITY_DN11124_c0_g1_i4:45-449(+)